MHSRLFQLMVTFFAFGLNATTLAGHYSFKGRTYKLSPFIEPKLRTHINYHDYEESLEKNNFPPLIDLRDTQTPVKDQSDRGSCAHFSSTALLESLIKVKINEDVNISEEYLIYYTKAELGQFPNSEGSRSKNNLYAYQDGFLLEKDSPYQPGWFKKTLPCDKYDDNSKDTPIYCFSHYAPSNEVLKRKIVNYDLKIVELDKYYKAYSTQIIKQIAKKRSPVIVSLPVNQKGWDAETGHVHYSKELHDECRKNKDLCGGHAILVTGYDLNKKVFMFKNTWGADWGDGGYGTFPFRYVDRHSINYPVTATINIDSPNPEIFLPPGHSDPVEVKMTDISLNVDLTYIYEATEEKHIYISLDSSVSYLKNNIFYMSTFIGYPIDLETPIGDDNFTLLKSPKEFQEEYGYYVAGRFYHFFDTDSVIFDSTNPSEMKIPYKLLEAEDEDENEDKAALENLYLRVSAYNHNDTSGWTIQYREYLKMEIE